MRGYDLVPGLGRQRESRFRPAAWILIPLAAILFQVYVPRFVPSLSYLELPLLVTIYFSLMRRQPVMGAVTGSLIGLAQDSLSSQPLGMYGIVKTLVGYFCASVSVRFDVENSALRFMMTFFFFLFHQLLFWVLSSALLGSPYDFQLPQTIIFGFLNAVVGVPLYLILDKLKTEGR